MLSDNGAIYTAAYRGAHTGLEIELAALGIKFKHGKPYHPQTQGKVERYHQTLKKWLAKKPACTTVAELQTQIDRFVHVYNEERPHTARRCPPMRAWRALDKATVEIDGQPMLAHTKVRHDRIDDSGCFTLRYRSKLHHIGVGRAQARPTCVDPHGRSRCPGHRRRRRRAPSLHARPFGRLPDDRTEIGFEGSAVPELPRHHNGRGLEPTAT